MTNQETKARNVLHTCQHCGVETCQPDSECYRAKRPAYILSTNYEKLYSLIEAGVEVVFLDADNYTGSTLFLSEDGGTRWLMQGEEVYQIGEGLDQFLSECTRLQLQYIVPNAGQVEELVKARLEPLEPFTAEFLSMMLSLGISRLTEAQRYALADGLLERLPERPNYWKQRCLLAEKCMEESPSDPDITTAQIEAHKEYNEFLSNQNNPEGG